jgi:hypothetical protein
MKYAGGTMGVGSRLAATEKAAERQVDFRERTKAQFRLGARNVDLNEIRSSLLAPCGFIKDLQFVGEKSSVRELSRAS